MINGSFVQSVSEYILKIYFKLLVSGVNEIISFMLLEINDVYVFVK